MNSIRPFLFAAVCAVAATFVQVTPATASPVEGDGLEWIEANGRPCEQVCRAARLQPVSSGVHAPGGREMRDRFYICAADMNGWRPGYNLQPQWSRACWVGFGGREVAAPNYACACR